MKKGRKAGVRYWARKGGGYFTTIQGAQVELALGPDDQPDGPTYLAALAEFARRMALDAGKGSGAYLVSALFNKYREYLGERQARERRPISRLAEFDKLARSFADLYGALPVAELKAYHFDDWLRARPTWNDTSRYHAGKHVLMALSYGVKRGLIPSHPVAGKVELPQPVARGKEARIPEALCDLLISQSFSPRFALFQRLLRLTGCRPIELRMAQAAHYRGNGDGARLVFRWNTRPGEYRHKTARTKKDRVIHLPPELVLEVEAMVAQHPEGCLFRSPRGKPWTRFNLSKAWLCLLRRPQVASYLAAQGIDRQHLSPYCYRHTFISNWVDSGRSIHVCAKLCGTSATMIERVYGHPDEEQMGQHYREFLANRVG